MVASVVRAALGFARPADVVPDHERPGLLRAVARTENGNEALDVHVCSITDWSGDGDFEADLFDQGFGVADLSAFDVLQGVFERVRRVGCITEADAAAIRSELDGATLTLSSGRAIRIQFVSTDGLFLRTAGPNGLKVGAALDDPMNTHDAATSIHADQDVLGTPMKQLMDGRAAELFRHDAPDTTNPDGSLLLLNVWIPLDQVTRPLVHADSTSLDRPKHQLRYGLRVDGFLDRPEDERVNDIWLFLHDDGQRWYFRSEMDSTSAYVFDTFGSAHGSFIVPGEEEAEKAYLALEAAEAAFSRGDVDEIARALGNVDEIDATAAATPALRAAIDAMVALLREARREPKRLRGDAAHTWLAAAHQARSRVVRKSIEMRVVAVLA